MVTHLYLFFFLPSIQFLFHFGFSHRHGKLCFHVLFLAHYKYGREQHALEVLFNRYGSFAF